MHSVSPDVVKSTRAVAMVAAFGAFPAAVVTKRNRVGGECVRQYFAVIVKQRTWRRFYLSKKKDSPPAKRRVIRRGKP